MRSLLLAIAFALPSAPLADARVERNSRPPHMLATSMRIATAASPPGPCSGRERVILVPGLTDDGRPVGGLADRGRCVALIERANVLDPPGLCSLVVHEFMHLAGVEHSENSRNIMYAHRLNYWPGCRMIGMRIR